MSQNLAEAYNLIREQANQLGRLAQLMEANIAIRDAHNTVPQSLIPLLRDDPRFASIVTAVNNIRLTSHVQQDVSNVFVETYIDAINALMPDNLKVPLSSIDFANRGK